MASLAEFHVNVQEKWNEHTFCFFCKSLDAFGEPKDSLFAKSPRTTLLNLSTSPAPGRPSADVPQCDSHSDEHMPEYAAAPGTMPPTPLQTPLAHVDTMEVCCKWRTMPAVHVAAKKSYAWKTLPQKKCRIVNVSLTKKV